MLYSHSLTHTQIIIYLFIFLLVSVFLYFVCEFLVNFINLCFKITNIIGHYNIKILNIFKTVQTTEMFTN